MKVAIYCRLSDEDQDKVSQHDDSASIRNQKAMLIQYASSNGWTIYDIYSDEDYTGSDRKRPEFNRLIADAMAGKFNIVLCKTQSRFTRELELVEKYIHGLFPRLGIRFVSLVDCADTDDKGNKKARQINGLVNEWFLEDLSDNIKATLTSRRKQGCHIGSFAPYGYMKDPEQKGHLIIDPEASAIVKEIYSLYLQGNGKRVIARILNDRGVPNPTEYKRLHGQVRNKHARNSTLWSYFTITNILTNEVYIGNMIQGKTGVISYKTQEKVAYPQAQWIVVKGTHEPIIDQNVWDNVQELAARKATPGRNEPKGVFSGKVRCISCGTLMHTVKNGRKRGFACNRHALSREACVGAYISLPKLERIVLAQLQSLSEELLDPEELERGIDPFPELREQRAKLEEEICYHQRKNDDSNAAMRNLYLAKAKGTICEEEHRAALFQIGKEKADCKRQITEDCISIREIEETLTRYSNRKMLAEQYLGNIHLSKEMVNALIDQIFVGKRDPVTKYTPVEIHWKF